MPRFPICSLWRQPRTVCARALGPAAGQRALAQPGFLPRHVHSTGAAASQPFPDPGPPQGLRERAKISTAGLLTAPHLWVDAGASEVLPLLSNKTTAGSLSREQPVPAAQHARPLLRGRAEAGLACREMSLGAAEFCLIIVICSSEDIGRKAKYHK